MSISSKKIDLNDIEFSPFSIIDDFGRVFYWRGRVFRAIRQNCVVQATELFTSGLIPRLVAEGLFVDSIITDYEINGYGMVVEHQLASVVTFPYEWSFSMLKAAGEGALRLNNIAATYGYQTKDIHPYNVLFFGLNPKFIDLGSFIPISGRFLTHLYSYQEFLKCYVFPLKIWTLGDSYSARRYIQRWKLMMPVTTYVSYRLAGNVGVLRRLISKIWCAGYKLQYLPHSINLPQSRAMSSKYSWLYRIVARMEFPFLISKIKNLSISLAKYNLPKQETMWGNYHDQLYLFDRKIQLSERLKKVVEIVFELSPTTVTDVAGNQGVLSQVISELECVERVVCVDYDDDAIDKGYVRSSKLSPTPSKLHYAVVNPFYSESNKFESEPSKRFKSELVMALALTHHLVLTQGYSLSYIFSVISSFSEKYVLIEFMPLGLYDSVNAISSGYIPSWYTEEWFGQEFERHFTLIYSIKLEANRILFIGQVIATQQIAI